MGLNKKVFSIFIGAGGIYCCVERIRHRGGKTTVINLLDLFKKNKRRMRRERMRIRKRK